MEIKDNITLLMKVRQIIAENKINETCELVENIIEQGKKVIVFTNFTDTLNRITDHFGKKAVKLDGKMSKVARQNSVDQFQENDKIKGFVVMNKTRMKGYIPENTLVYIAVHQELRGQGVGKIRQSRFCSA